MENKEIKYILVQWSVCGDSQQNTLPVLQRRFMGREKVHLCGKCLW